MSRTPEEREAARLERERRRAERAGRPPQPVPPAPAPEPRESVRHSDVQPHAAVPEPAHDPQPTQVFDVTAQWTEERTAVAAPPEPPEPAPEREVPLGTRRVTRGVRPPAQPPRARTPRPAGTGGAHWGRRVVALLALAAIVLAGWFLWSTYQPGKGEGSGRVVVRVPRGATVSEIGDLLADRGVIDSPFFFKLRTKLSGGAGDVKSGTFTLRADMSYGAALEALSRTPPPPPVIRITIPEGKSRGETAPIARQAGLRGSYAAASRSFPGFDPRRYGAPRGATLEGFLFPATYELRRRATARDLVQQQLAAFRQNLAKVDLRYARSKNLTVFDVLTIASMVEREVAVARERPLVAAVIYNRLRDGMTLGIDATLRFALGNWTEPLKVSELGSDTPYNTRNHAGLPPGPIGNPGLASIEAAAHPAKVPYLFYVVKPGTCGEHSFASTDAEHQRNVERYNAARDAAGGKSPTRC
ncbi:MAG TPA: endolytic transglycosylase MltG [Conexibacter sp.]|nr:endolytic transglycosylase MltG [Conexibacter sp.]